MQESITYVALYSDLHMECSLSSNNIGDAGARVLGEGLKHCTYMKELK